MHRILRPCVAMILLLATTTAFAAFHLFRIEQLYSNADGTVQFVVLHEFTGTNGENFWAGQSLTSTHAGSTKTFMFPSNLPSSSTAGRRVLVASQGFAALNLVTPNYVVPNGFLPTDGGTLNYAGVDQITYASLPTDGVIALDRSGSVVQNLATNFAGETASVAAAPTVFSPVPGIWANPNESGTGYALDYHNGILVLAIYSYQAGGPAQWYLAAGAVTANVFTATLDKYVGGQCISCAFAGRPTLAGNDGTITVTFTSSRSATVNLPGGRVTQIAPFEF